MSDDNSVPNGTITLGQVWTVAQWNAAWQSKVDEDGGIINSPAIVGGTQSAPTITNPTIDGGTQASPTINTPTIATPAITGAATLNGEAFAASAITDTTNASNISAGTLSGSRMAAVNLAASGNGGVTGTLPLADVNPAGTQTWDGLHTFSAGLDATTGAFSAALTLGGEAVATLASPPFTGTPTIGGVPIPTFPITAAETAASVVPSSLLFPVGSLYRYGAKGGAGRTPDGVIGAAGVITSASGAFANAAAGMVAVVVDGGASRTGGRPAPLITTIASVQSAHQITLSVAPSQPASISMNGTLNGTVNVTSTSANPITAGVGLARNWTVTGTNIPPGCTIAGTSASTLLLSGAATGSGVSALTLAAPVEVCFGFDDSVAILAALSLPYPITDAKDNFLTTQSLTFGNTGCNDFQMPSALFIGALSGNTSPCMSGKGLDRSNGINYLIGIRYQPFIAIWGEFDCCNTGLGGFSLGPSINAVIRGRITNAFRSAFEEFFLVDGHWQEGNQVEINCGLVGLHFHHKVTKSASYQNLARYQVWGRGPGLNSVFLGINASTQPDQCGGGIRLYTGGSSAGADGGMSQNVWGSQSFNEMDGERSVALSYGSDICNSAVTFVDASANYVIEGSASAHFSNTYRSNNFLNNVIEDITQSSDTRGGFQYYAMANTVVQSSTVLASSAGPWGAVYANPNMLSGADNLIRWVQRFSYPGTMLLGDVAGNFFAAGYLGLPANNQTTNYTLQASDVGKAVQNSAGTQTIPQNVFAQGNTVDIVAFGGALAIAAGTGVTLNWFNGTTLVNTTPRALANGAKAQLYFAGPNQVVITGSGIS